MKGRKQPVALYTPYPPLPPPAPVQRTFDNNSGRNSPSSQSHASTNPKSFYHSGSGGSGRSSCSGAAELLHDPLGEHFLLALSTQRARIAAASLAALLRFADLGYHHHRSHHRNCHQPHPQQSPPNLSHTRLRRAASAVSNTLEALKEHAEHESRMHDADAGFIPATAPARSASATESTAASSEMKAELELKSKAEAPGIARSSSSSSSSRLSKRYSLVLGSFDFEGNGRFGSFATLRSEDSGGTIDYGSIAGGVGGGISGSVDLGYATRKYLVNLDASTVGAGEDEVAIAAEAAVSGGHSAAAFLATVAGQKLLREMATRTRSSGDNFSRMTSMDLGSSFESQQAVSSWYDDEPSIADPRQFWKDVSKSVTKRKLEASRARLARHQGRDYRGDTPGVYPKGSV